MFKITLTEESKILPASGIYAVSAEAGSTGFKGMAIINRGKDLGSEVLVYIFDEPDFITDSSITLSFHKKIHGAVDLSDLRSVSKINQASEEISDLIY